VSGAISQRGSGLILACAGSMSVSPLRIDASERQTVARRPTRMLPAPNELHIEPRAWWALADTQVDALIVGDGVAISRVLTCIWPMLRKPVFWCEGRRLFLPARCASTVVLEDAHALDAGDQGRLREWLERGTESLRLIATSSTLLLPLVEEGKFSRELYARFTAMRLVIT
jgi:hypothetical protein